MPDTPVSSDALQAAVDALRAEVEDRPTGVDSAIPLLSHLTVGNLATLLDTLDRLGIGKRGGISIGSIVIMPADEHRGADVKRGDRGTVVGFDSDGDLLVRMDECDAQCVGHDDHKGVDFCWYFELGTVEVAE